MDENLLNTWGKTHCVETLIKGARFPVVVLMYESRKSLLLFAFGLELSTRTKMTKRTVY